MKKFYLLIQQKDKYDHFCAWVRPVTNSDNIAAVIRGMTDAIAVNIYPTKKEAARVCDMLNKYWHEDGVYTWDYMEDGTTPAPLF